MSPPRYVLIANPGTKRCEAYRRAVAEVWGGRADLTVVPWADVIRGGGRLAGLAAFDRPAVVRLESPGKDAAVTRLLCGVPPETPLPKGVLFRPGAWYAGFRRVLVGLKAAFDERPHLTPTACPLAVAAMFDKNATLATLAAAGVPVPDWLPPDRLPPSPDALYDRLRALGWRTAYMKLNTGASAVGIVVLRFDAAGAPHGLTTLVRHGGHFFNTRRLRTVAGDALRACVAFLLAEGATVQRAVPHAQLDGQNADLRVVCVRGRPVATIFRLSPHPVTNLHLGGRRGDWAACRAAIPPRHWLDALDGCAAAAGCFASAVAGVDVVFEPGFARHAVLEVNAFGDFFPGVTDPLGRSPHAVEIAETAARLVGPGARPTSPVAAGRRVV